MNTSTADRTKTAPVLPPPLLSWKAPGLSNKCRFLGQFATKLVWAAILGRIGWYVWVTLYFVATQNPLVKPHWDGLFPYSWWAAVRHFLRDGGEYLFGSMFAWLALTNPFSARSNKPLNRFEMSLSRIHIPSRAQKRGTTLPQFLLSPATVFVAALPGITLAYLCVLLLGWVDNRYGIPMHHYTASGVKVSHPAGHSLLNTISRYMVAHVANYAGTLGGLIFGRYVFNRVALDVQRLMVTRRLAQRNGRPHWPLPATYQALYTSMETEPVIMRRSRAMKWATMVTPIVLLLLAATGWYIIRYIAPH